MWRLSAFVASVLVGASSLSAQTDASRSSTQQSQATFKSGVDLVTLSVAVRTEKGRIVRDLQSEDFTVLDSGRPTKIVDFYVGDSPISLAILLDISGSMAVGGNMDRAREAVNVATMNLRGGEDEAALFTFDSELRQVVGFTKDLENVRRVSLKGTPGARPLSMTRSATPRPASVNGQTGIAPCSSSLMESTQAANSLRRKSLR